MKDATTRIADKVRGLAAENRFTQQRVADTLRLSRTSVAERYSGRVPFTAPEILALADAMQVPVERFYPDIQTTSTRDPLAGVAGGGVSSFSGDAA